MTWIELAGAVNVRDLGGLPTVDGRLTRTGVLLRADSLQDLTSTDIEELRRRGLGTVLDLRTSAEVEILGPGPLRDTPVKHVHLDLIPHGFEGRSVLERTIPDETAPEHAVDHLYFDYVRDAPDAVATALRTIADPGSGVVLVHCAAGKDRTGVLVALALSLVGVRRDAVVEDYARTDERIEAIVGRLLSSPLYSEHAGGRSLDSFRPHVWNMERFLDRIDREYGGVHGLAMSIGIDEETVARMSRRLLDV
ncbi:MAG: tyrosine-protein phosphatase [Actinomycetota bacterium]|nr:tyrosine-protein phosphatase [Actinomycetota bacterium]